MMCTDKSFRINTGYSSQKKFRFHNDFKVKPTHTQVMSYPSHTHTHTLLTRANPACFSVCVCHFLLRHPHSLLMFPSGVCVCVCVCVCVPPLLFSLCARAPAPAFAIFLFYFVYFPVDLSLSGSGERASITVT